MTQIATLETDLQTIPFASPGVSESVFDEQIFDLPEILHRPMALASFQAPKTTAPHEDYEPSATGEISSVDAMPTALTANWSRLFLSDLSAKSYARILQFARLNEGWRGAGSKSLSDRALEAFLEFLIRLGDDVVEPELTLTARGTLHAEWFRNTRRHLDLEFISEEKVFFGLFDGKTVYEGIDCLNGLSSWLKQRSSQPLKWRSR